MEVHSSTALAPLDLLLSRSLNSLSLEALSKLDGTLACISFTRWLIALQRLMATASANIQSSRTSYKRIFDNCFTHWPLVCGFVFLRLEYASEAAEVTRKLAKTADGFSRSCHSQKMPQRSPLSTNSRGIVPAPTPP